MLKWFKKDKKKGIRTRKVGLEVAPDGIAMACAQWNAGHWNVPFYSFIEEHGKDHQQRALLRLVDQYGLKGSECHYVLHPSEYELLLTDAPNVEDNELTSALRWRVKDMLSMSINEIVIDVFSLPKEAYRGRMKMIYVAVVRRHIIEEIVKMTAAVGLKLKVIDIAELALCNLMRLLPEKPGKSIGLLQLRSTSGLMNLVQDGSLCFTRSIETTLQQFDTKDNSQAYANNLSRVEDLLLEIQRSLDYYETQIGMGVIDNLWLAPLKYNIPGLVEALKEKISIKFNVFDINQFNHMHLKAEIPLSGQAYYLTALGAALRKEML